MERRTLLILSLILSVISLGYLIANYIGWIRYCRLRYTDSFQGCVKNYSKLEKGDKNRVVVCFSAKETDLNNLKPMLSSLLDQTVRVDDICLVIPSRMIDKVPEELKKILTTYGYQKDYDDAAPLICSVLREPEGSTKIIIVNPNRVYGNDFIESMIERSNREQKVVYEKEGDSTSAILVKPEFFDESISKYQKGSGLKAWLAKCCKVGNCCL